MANDRREGELFDPFQLELAIAQHPLVAECAVQTIRDDGGSGIVAHYVRESEAVEAYCDGGAVEAAHLAHWQVRYEEFYSQAAAPCPQFDTRGWNCSYTGRPIPLMEMREWLDDTTAAIVALRPRKVLEIGCGSGLVLFRLAPYCSEYVATDFSAVMIERLGRELRRAGQQLSHVSLMHQSATTFEGLSSRDFDVVILNSVIQYFPTADYLMRVIDGAVERTRAGGAVFVGDVRSLPLMEAQHLSLECHRSARSVPIQEFCDRVATAMREENELLVHPSLFGRLPKVLPRVGHVEVMQKRGRYHNELSRFRYQVLLYIEPVPEVVGELVWHDWRSSSSTLAHIEGELRDNEPRPIALANVPNARLTHEFAIRALVTDNRVKTLCDIHERARYVSFDGIDPEEVIALGERQGYKVRLSWLRHNIEGSFDAVFLPPDAGILSYRIASPEPCPHAELTNNPAKASTSHALPAQLRLFLQTRFPELIVPSLFVDVPKLPRTQAGEIDRASLKRHLATPDG